MDITITPSPGSAVWEMTDLLGRSMGQVTKNTTGTFGIYPAGGAIKTMADISAGPYASLDAALAAIETGTRGVCRMAPGDETR